MYPLTFHAHPCIVSLCIAVVPESLKGGHEMPLQYSLFVLTMAMVDIIGLPATKTSKTKLNR